MSDIVLLLLRILTACSSTIMILSPAPTLYKIHTTQDVGHMSIVALATLLGNCHMWMLHGYLRRNIFPVFTTFAVGDVIALAFIAVYVRHTSTEKRAFVLQVVGCTIAVLAVVTLYALLALHGETHESRASATTHVGYIAIVAAVLLYGAPFEKVLIVVRDKTSVSMPLPMVLVGTLNNALWVIYTPLDHNWFMFVPNAICVVLGVVQLCLYWFYHPSRSQHRQGPLLLDAPIAEVNIDVDDIGADGERSNNGISVAIIVDESLKTDRKPSFPQSPSYELVHSPLAPPRRAVVAIACRPQDNAINGDQS